MTNRPVVLVVGMPGSGKTHLLNTDFWECTLFDDMSEYNFAELERHLDYVTHVPIVIADVNFCFKEKLDRCIAYLKGKGITDIEIIYFENDKEKCLKNVMWRRDGRLVEGYIELLSKVYDPPKDKVREIWKSPWRIGNGNKSSW